MSPAKNMMFASWAMLFIRIISCVEQHVTMMTSKSRKNSCGLSATFAVSAVTFTIVLSSCVLCRDEAALCHQRFIWNEEQIISGCPKDGAISVRELSVVCLHNNAIVARCILNINIALWDTRTGSAPSILLVLLEPHCIQIIKYKYTCVIVKHC